MIHELKTLPQYFNAVVSGEKSFEVRKFDRPFHKGDLLALNEFNAETKCYTGNSCLVYIDYILNDKEYVKSDYVILGIKPCAIHRFGTPYNPYSRVEDYSVPYATKEIEGE
jgi:hypothetical protein